jgi:ATP-dependent Clp protease adaptor protein ClpS
VCPYTYQDNIMSDTETVVKIKTREDIKEPLRYHVIYLNDDVTTQEFVVESLVAVFNYDRITAEELTMKIHHEGSSIVATLPYEMAEQKGVEVTLLARNNGYPLVVKLEPEA